MNEAVILEVWRQRDAWSRESSSAKKRQEASRRAALSLGFAGAVCGTLAAQPIELFKAQSTLLGIMAALLVALSGFLGRELLSSDQESQWSQGRILAEALQRECWLYLTRCTPYAASDRAEQLRTRCAALLANLGLERGPITASSKVEVPQVHSIDEYIEQRALEQAAWYERRSGEHRSAHQMFRTITFLLGVLAVGLSVVGTTKPWLLAFLPILTTASGALVAWTQGSRIGAATSLYQQAAAQLRLSVAAFRDAASERVALPAAEQTAAEVALVQTCEAIMAQENGAWRAEWTNEEKARGALSALQAVTGEGKRPTLVASHSD
jgi:hypothetical protein